MAGMSRYLEQSMLNETFRNGDVYLALFINDPTDDNTGTEISTNDTGYARQQISFDIPTVVSDKTLISNNALIQFPIATGNWGTVTHWAIMSSTTAGNQLCNGSFNVTDEVVTGRRFNIDIGNIKIYAS